MPTAKSIPMKVLPTRYAGIDFRSRTEARWAVFFNTLGVRWVYEMEGFDLPSGNYLPDFWLPDQSCWFEVKGEHPTERETSLAMELATATGNTCYIAFGMLPRSEEMDASGPEYRRVEGESFHACFGYDEDHGGWDLHYEWTLCHVCDKADITFDARGARVDCPCDHSQHGNGDKCYNGNDQRIVHAYETAATWRFWDPAR